MKTPITYTLLVSGYNIRRYFQTWALPGKGDVVVFHEAKNSKPERFSVSHVEHVWYADAKAPEFVVHAEQTKET